MPRYEVLTPLSNGRKKAHPVGSVVELEEGDAADLVAIAALRPVAGEGPVGESREPESDAGPGAVTQLRAVRNELAGKSHKHLDAILKSEGVGDVVHAGPKPTVKEKAAAIVDHRIATALGLLRTHDELLTAAQGAGLADLGELGLPEDAEFIDLRDALIERITSMVAEG